MNNNYTNKQTNNALYMIPKIEKHIEYALGVILKLPRVEKFNIGGEMKKYSLRYFKKYSSFK